MCRRIERVALNLSEFQQLHPATQHALLRHNTDLIVSLRGAVFFDQAKRGLDQIIISLGVDDVNAVHNLMQSFGGGNGSMPNNTKMNRISYETFNTIQVKEKESRMEDRYDFLLARVGQVWSLTQFYSVDFSHIKNRCEQVLFQQAYDQGLSQLFLTVSCDLPA